MAKIWVVTAAVGLGYSQDHQVDSRFVSCQLSCIPIMVHKSIAEHFSLSCWMTIPSQTINCRLFSKPMSELSPPVRMQRIRLHCVARYNQSRLHPANHSDRLSRITVWPNLRLPSCGYTYKKKDTGDSASLSLSDRYWVNVLNKQTTFYAAVVITTVAYDWTVAQSNSITIMSRS